MKFFYSNIEKGYFLGKIFLAALIRRPIITSQAFFSVNMNAMLYVNSINIVHGSKKKTWKHAHLS